jgi:amino acid transporter
MAVFLVGGLLAVPTFISGKGAEDTVERLPGVDENIIEAHEAFASAALISSIILAAICAYGLLRYRRKDEEFTGTDAPVRKRFGRIDLYFVIIVAIAALAVSGIVSYTGNLGGQIRHTEIRSGTTVPLQDTTQNNITPVNPENHELEEEQEEKEEGKDDGGQRRRRRGRDK